MDRLTTEQAARLMGVRPAFIRIGLQQGRLPFGWAVKTGADSWTYWISRKRFFEETGIKEEKEITK